MPETGETVHGDPFTRLANAAEETAPCDRLLAESWTKMQRMGTALRLLGEELAEERRRTRHLQGELDRLRAERPRARSVAGPEHARRRRGRR